MQQALSDGKLQVVKAQLERRGVQMNAAEAMALKLPNGEQLLIPFGATAHLVWTRTGNQTAALGLVRQGQKTLNLSSDGSERVVRMLEGAKVQRLLGKLREKVKFQEFEQRLREKGKRLAENKLRVLLDETGKTAIVGLVSEGSDKIVHQLRIRLKANKNDELEQNAEPQIQPTACGQASGEAVMQAQGAQLQPQELGEFGSSWGAIVEYEPETPRHPQVGQVCISQWGYTYLCLSTIPSLRVQTPGSYLDFGVSIVGWQVQASFTVWNYGGGTLTGITTVSTPFEILSGGSFSLAPGQHQEVVVRFSPAAAGDFSSNVRLTTNGGNYDVSLRGKALTFEEYLDLLIEANNAINQISQPNPVDDIDDIGRVPPSEKLVYGTVSLWNEGRNHNWVIGGHPNIDRATLLQMQAASEQAQNDVQTDSVSKEFLKKIAVIRPEEMNNWLQLLKQAIQENRFDEEYNRLLLQGLSELRDSLLLLNDSPNSSELVKSIIRNMSIMATPMPPSISLDQASGSLRERLERMATQLVRFFWMLEIIGNPLHLIPDLGDFCERVEVCNLLGPITIAPFAEHLEEINCTSISSCIREFIETVHYTLTATYRELGTQAGDTLLGAVERLLSHYTSGSYGVRSAVNLMGSLWGVVQWMERGTRSSLNLKDRLERGISTLLVSDRLASRGWKTMGFIKGTYSYGTWWGALSYLYGPALSAILGKVVAQDVVQVALVSGGDHCKADCGAKADEIVAWVGEAIRQADRYKDTLQRRQGFTPWGTVSFAFTHEGAQGVFQVLDALRAAFKDSPTPIIVSWTSDSGEVWFMCIGSAAACNHFRNMGWAQQIACAQQWHVEACTPRELREPLPPSSDLPPPSGNKSVQIGGAGGSDP
ncbi:MAG: hypothetical protein QW376_08495 [Candidatus Caldarchaeum sp.]